MKEIGAKIVLEGVEKYKNDLQEIKEDSERARETIERLGKSLEKLNESIKEFVELREKLFYPDPDIEYEQI